MRDALDLLGLLAIVIATVAATPFVIWLIQGWKPKGGGVMSGMLEGLASAFEPQHVQEARRAKPEGRRENGDPPITRAE